MMLKWTSEPPTQEGWYFYQRINPPNFYPIRMVYCCKVVYRNINRTEMTLFQARRVSPQWDDRGDTIWGVAISDMDDHYRWAGPIPEPEGMDAENE